MKNLTLQPIGIGSLPYKNPEDAMNLIEKDFYQIPYLPQLPQKNKNEDMLFQFLEGMPSLYNAAVCDDFFIDTESRQFILDFENLNSDYDEIIQKKNSMLLEKYFISEENCSSLELFLQMIGSTKPAFAKVQIAGAFTLSDEFKDQNGNYGINNENIKEAIVKLLGLKALWLLKKIKTANQNTFPVIFIDEPKIAEIGTPAYKSILPEDAASMIKSISEMLKSHGVLTGVHCCGKCNPEIQLKSDVDIINFDVYSFNWDFKLYARQIKEFLSASGKIAWGLVPTSSNKLFQNLTIEQLIKKYNDCVKDLTKCGINEKLITDNSLITSSCGAGQLTENNAKIAMNTIKNLSDRLKEVY